MARGVIQASGAVVFRGLPGAEEVLVVHRPAYDDWTLPKGKVGADEYLVTTAVREVREETGYSITLLRQLSQTRYAVEGRPKTVQWWLGELNDPTPGPHDAEADRVEWWPLERAFAQLSYPDEAAIVSDALRCPRTRPLLVVRHAKAMSRKDWHGHDADRRLTERGRRQAQSLVDLFEAFGVGRLASSSSTRCMRTLVPYAERKGLAITGIAALSEESATSDPDGVRTAMAALLEPDANPAQPLAVCGHRPVLPLMFRFLAVTPRSVLRPGEVVLIHPGESGQGEPLVHIPPTL